MTSLAPKPGVRGSGGYLMKILSNLTIEPAFFIMSVSIALEQIATQQMVVLKSCKIDFNYTDEICNNLQSENYTEEKLILQWHGEIVLLVISYLLSTHC